MKKMIFFFAFMGLSAVVFGQNPVSWTFQSQKKSTGVYILKIKAIVPSPWHIYSQFTPDGGPVPTKFTFSPSPLISLVGNVKESGMLKQVNDKNFGVDVKYFKGSVAFTQTVKLKKNIRTNINGTVEYMVCNDHECLPPTTKNFSIKL